MKIVNKILQEVKTNGDAAIRLYTKKFDKMNLKNFEVTQGEIKKAYQSVDKETIKALKAAKRNTEFFAKRQMQQFKDFEIKKDGLTVGQKVIPIETIGAYIPGGNYPLPSTALMCIIPARIAGVKNIIACSPKIRPETIVAADLAGAGRLFRIGGAQAIAAMAYGTRTIPKVDKIVGPGNIYVTAAKKEIFGQCRIDFLAGPSEVMIIADSTTDSNFAAADLLAQLEHDTNSRAFLISSSKELIKNVKDKIKLQLDNLVTKSIIKKSIKNLKIIKIKNIEDGINISNQIAPEHLELQVKNPEKYMKKLKNYGSLFLGKYSVEAFGDYCSGTNHVLPTNGGARFTGGLSVRDFIKLQTYQKINYKGVKKLAPIALKLSKIEGLDGHRKSTLARLEKRNIYKL